MTVAELNKSWEVTKWRCLDEIDAGICDGLTYQQVLEQFPDEYRKRKEDKYNYRYPVRPSLPPFIRSSFVGRRRHRHWARECPLFRSHPLVPFPSMDQRGESYQDVFLRLEPVIFEMLRTTTPLLIVGHQAILRVIYG